LKKVQKNADYGSGGELNTFLGKGSQIAGNLKIENSLRVDGVINGNVSTTETIILGKDGKIEGNVTAKHVILAGNVTGNILAEGKAFLETTAIVTGDIQASKLVIDEGAVFDGQCVMSENSITSRQSV